MILSAPFDISTENTYSKGAVLMSECYVNESLERRTCSDRAFMGTTHALSAVAVFLGVIFFAPDFVHQALGSSSPWVIVLSIAVTSGASLVPDLDNTTSTSKNSLGWLGIGLSYFFRISSRFLQTVIRTRRDDPSPNPHRGAWHTIPAALLLGGLTYWGTGNAQVVTLPVLNQITVGKLIALLITFLMVHMAMSGLAKDFMKKIKKTVLIGEALSFAVSLGLTAVIFVNLPAGLDYRWLGVSVAFGVFIHILGDTFTTAGTPILFPLSALIKGKFWWTTRFTTLKVGHETEKLIFGFFLVMSIIFAVLILVAH
jgi:membrane-bound metal-dependent hydrolase YbcI (DUF457 family)